MQKKDTEELPVIFKSGEQQIVGILHLSKLNKKAPLIIFCHGWSANRLGTWNAFFVKAAREFAKNNYAVLRFDFRGCGDSEGKFEDQTTTSMLEDLDNILSQITSYTEIDSSKICLIGHSQGGYVAFLKTAQNKRIKCFISWMGRLSDLKDFWGNTWIEEIKRQGYFYADDYKVTKKYFLDSLKYNSSKAAKKLKAPSLFIYGGWDSWVPAADGSKIYKLVRSSKKFVVLKTLDHLFSGENCKKRVIDLTLSWLKKFLK